MDARASLNKAGKVGLEIANAEFKDNIDVAIPEVSEVEEPEIPNDVATTDLENADADLKNIIDTIDTPVPEKSPEIL